MRTEQMKYFLDAAENGSMLKAAEKNFLTQPAISSSISKLEDELGVLLINRSKQGINLTDAGKIVQKNFLHIQQLFAQMDQELMPYQNSPINHLHASIKLCATLEISNSLVNEVIHQFYRRFPYCAFSVKEYDFLDIITTVGNGTSEFGVFCIIEEVLKEPVIQEKLTQYDLTIEELGYDKLTVAIANHEPLAKKKSIPLKTILQKPLAIYNSSLDKCWHDLFFKKYDENIQLIQTNSPLYLMDLLRNMDYLVFFLNGKMMQARQNKASFYSIVPVKEKFKVVIGLIYKKNACHDVFTRTFFDLLRHYLKTF